MAWKLKKSKASDDADDAVSVASQNPESDVDFSTAHNPAEALFDSTENSDTSDFFASRLSEADETIAELGRAKETNGSAAPNGTSPAAGEEEEWSLDAFAPYKPAERLDFDSLPPIELNGNETAETSFTPLSAETHAEDLHRSNIDFDETETGFGETTDFAIVHPEATDDEELGSNWELSEGAAPAMNGLTEFAEPLVSEPEPLTPAAFDKTLHTSNGFNIEDIAAAPEDDLLIPLPAPTAAVIPVDENQTLAQVDIPEEAPPAAKPKRTPRPATPAPAETPVAAAPAPAPVAPPAPIAIKPALIVRLGAFTATYDLGEGDLLIGRPDPNTGAVPDINIELDDAISRRHAHVFKQGEKYYIEDLGSKNGTYLNDQVLPSSTPAPLFTGDRVRVGERTEITFQQ